MNIKNFLRTAIILFIESDGNPYTFGVRFSKKHVIAFVNRILPEE